MTLQSAVSTTLAAAVAGDKASANQSIYTAVTPLAGEGGATVGIFGWVQADGTVIDAGTTAPTGFVERVISYPNYTVTSAGTLVIPEGYPVQLAIRGDYWVETTQTAAVGGQVYVNQTTGAIEATNSSSTNVAATGWFFKTAGDAGDMVIISNWG